MDVLHTKKPIASQFDILLEQGEITMDHLIKRNERGRGNEKGPLFKINTNALGLLFPPPETYALHQAKTSRLLQLGFGPERRGCFSLKWN